MKTIFLVMIVFFQVPFAWSNCEAPILIDKQNYCWAIFWRNGDKKIKNKFENTQENSPFLIPMRERPQNWIYSKAKIKLWQQNDLTKAPKEIPNLRVFPYMHMIHGHHHSTEYEFLYDAKSKMYSLEQMTLHEMHGCWSLRWSTNKDDVERTSQLLVKLTRFENLNEAANKKVNEYCNMTAAVCSDPKTK
jgi:hypothetical protein